MSFECSTILEHIPQNLQIIIGLLELEIFKIFKEIYGSFSELSRY